jgi:hypothetical protein
MGRSGRKDSRRESEFWRVGRDLAEAGLPGRKPRSWWVRR